MRLLKLSILIESISRNVSRILAGFCAISVASAMLMISINIFLRSFWETWLPFVEEYTNYMMIGVTFMALGYTMRHDAHIKINIFEDILPVNLRPILQLIQMVIGIAATLVMLKYSFDFTLQALKTGQKASTVMLTPLWIPRAFMLIGYFFLVLELINMSLKKLLSQKGFGQG